jgi:MYXO-CTERM domain-containing protein
VATHQCVADSAATADPAPDFDATAPPQECPAGQVWSSVAGQCVMLGATTGSGVGLETDGCASGPQPFGGPAAGLLLGLAGLLARRRRA